MNVNFAFVRHGYACHNAMRNLYNNQIITRDDYSDMLGIRSDPELTQLGVDASKQNGCVIAKIIKNLHITEKNRLLNMETINIVGSSPLIRCMETAYYMTRNWKNPPNKIYIFPFLREIDESGSNIYSETSRARMDSIPSYSMKEIYEQKAYLQRRGILDHFDFSFVESDYVSRKEPGNIHVFLDWFSKSVLPYINITPGQHNLNVFATTHAGVLKHFAKRGFYNNSGFVVNTTMTAKGAIIGETVGLDSYLPGMFFSDYNNPAYDKTYYCPSDRCGTLCQGEYPTKKNKIKRIEQQCQADESDKLTFTTS